MNLDKLQIIDRPPVFENDVGCWVSFSFGGFCDYQVNILKDENSNLKIGRFRTLGYEEFVKNMKSIKELVALDEERYQLVENQEKLERVLGDYVLNHPKYRLKLLF